jgi:hypothetical protein
LHGRDGVEHVWVVAWRRAEAAILVQAAEDEVEDALWRQCIGLSKQVQSGKAPVDAAEAEVFGQVVFKFVLALLRASVLVKAASLYAQEVCVRCLDFVCRRCACRRPASARRGADRPLRRLFLAPLRVTCCAVDAAEMRFQKRCR